MIRKGSLGFLALLTLPALSTGGCYRTKTATRATPAAVEHEHRQWFTIAGLVPITGAAGSECGEAGMASSDSRLAGMDVLINIGLAVGGSLLGSGICDSDAEPAAYATCISSVGSLVPFLLGSRTVSYRCAQQ